MDLAERLHQLGKGILSYVFPKVHAARIPSSHGYFQRKEDREIWRQYKSLRKNSDVPSVKTLMLYGQAGSGKQSSAANLMNKIYRNAKKRRSLLLGRPAILWTINVNSQTTMLESYCSLAKEIGLTEEAKVATKKLSHLSSTSEEREYQKNARDEVLNEIYEAVKKKLRHHSPWVLLIKGPNEDIPRKFWPQPGDPNVGNGLVVITTQYSNLHVKEGADHSLEKVFIGEMKNEDAVKFLAIKSGIPVTIADKADAQDIAVTKLECVPQDIAR